MRAALQREPRKTRNTRKKTGRLKPRFGGKETDRAKTGAPPSTNRVKSMSITEPQPAEPKPERRPFQYSLRSLFELTCGIAAFFSLARTLGYVDALVILAAVVVAVGVMEYPRRVRPATAILITLVAGTLLWANLRTNGWAREFNLGPPIGLDPVLRSTFCHGWPFSACSIYLHNHMTDPGDPAMYWALTSDVVVFVVALLATRGVGELCLRWRAKLAVKTPPAGSTSGPPVE